MGKGVLIAGGFVVAPVFMLGSLAAPAQSASPSPASSAALSTIPSAYLTVYRQAAGTCPGESWTILAAIGDVESDHGQSTQAGVTSGANSAGAEGPMQFEPATFAAYDHPLGADMAATPAPPGDLPDQQSPYNPADAIYAAARMLCADNVASDPEGAIFAYNHDPQYVADVLAIASSYASSPAGSPVGQAVVGYALSQVGTPYTWGGTTPDGGFDCEGLVYWAYSMVGIAMPQGAQAQFDAGPVLASGDHPQPGDLVFFGSSPLAIGHVGIVVGDDMMVDAPHQGALVRVESIASFGVVAGYTRPGGSP